MFCLVVPFENFGKGIEPETDAALVPSPIDDVTVQFVGVLVEETGRAEVQHAIAAPDDKSLMLLKFNKIKSFLHRLLNFFN